MTYENVLIIKTGALGDVVRTTPILSLTKLVSISWFTSKEAEPLLHKSRATIVTKLADLEKRHFDLVISLEDDTNLLREIYNRITFKTVIGSYFADDGSLTYSESMSSWFDMGLISKFGLSEANKLKIANRLTYQEHLFHALKETFEAEPYFLPPIPCTPIQYDLILAPDTSKRWPMKKWPFYDDLHQKLSKNYKVLVLEHRASLIEHIIDIDKGALLVCNDSLPMHLGLGLNKSLICFFICTSPWEIYDYDRMTKLISPKLEEVFYSKEYNKTPGSLISLETACNAIDKSLNLLGKTCA